MTYIVYEYTEKAGPQYRGTRFMTVYIGENPNGQINLKVVAKDISEEEAYKLCDETVEKNIQAHLSEYPEELRTPEGDAFVANMIRNGFKGDI
jgi:ADP-dependent phosphofructokinase/glucokinase